MLMNHRFLLLVVALGAFSVISACNNEDEDAASRPSAADPAPTTQRSAMPESNRAMAQRLRDLADRADPSKNGFMNDQRAAAMEARFAAAGDMPPVQRADVEIRLGVELLLAGRTQDAIHSITAAYERLGTSSGISEQMRAEAQRWMALAQLRLGEQQNCIANHTSESCILPIRGKGVHTHPEGSRAAITLYNTLLQRHPDSITFRWLLNIAHMTLGQYPEHLPQQLRIPETVFDADAHMQRFDDVAMNAGVDVRGLSGGAIMDDFTGDDNLDIVCSSWGLGDQLRFFVNRGDGTFEDRTEHAQLIGQVSGLNLSHADYNNDGWLDILVLRGGWLFDQGEHPNSLLRNNGDGTFTDVTIESGIFSLHPSQTAAWADYNLDGHLDLAIGNESFQGAPTRCELWQNNGDGTFTNVARQAGLRATGIIKAVAFGDYDNDGRPDLYMSRFGDTNVLYHNDGPGDDRTENNASICTFTDVTDSAAVTRPVNSFPTWFFDYDNDGWLDLLAASFGGFEGDSLEPVILDMLGETSPGHRCHLYRNNRDGTFTDVSSDMAVDRVLLAMGANFGDIDNDGFLDCFFGTGEPVMSTLVPNVMLRNDGGRVFQDVTTTGGFGNIQKGHGVAFGDVDNDGDQDIYITMGGAFSGDIYQNLLYRNPGNDHHWVTLRLRGVTSNRAAVGARIAVHVNTPEGPRAIHRVVGTGGSFGSSSLQQEIGLGNATAIDRIIINWPHVDSRPQTINAPPIDAVLAITEDAADFKVVPTTPIPLGEAPTSPHQHYHDH